jgi:hypothetical protein
MGFVLALLVSAVTLVNVSDLAVESSAEGLVADFRLHRAEGEGLVFFGRRPYSAAFYSGGMAEEVRDPDKLLTRIRLGPVVIAMDVHDAGYLPIAVQDQASVLSRRGDRQLLRVRPKKERPDPAAETTGPAENRSHEAVKPVAD